MVPPPKQIRGRASLLLAPDAENTSYATNNKDVDAENLGKITVFV